MVSSFHIAGPWGSMKRKGDTITDKTGKVTRLGSSKVLCVGPTNLVQNINSRIQP